MKKKVSFDLPIVEKRIKKSFSYLYLKKKIKENDNHQEVSFEIEKVLGGWCLRKITELFFSLFIEDLWIDSFIVDHIVPIEKTKNKYFFLSNIQKTLSITTKEFIHRMFIIRWIIEQWRTDHVSLFFSLLLKKIVLTEQKAFIVYGVLSGMEKTFVSEVCFYLSETVNEEVFILLK